MPDIPAPRITAAEIHAVLRDRICLLDVPPGTLLRETDLAESFGVSRTPVREALQKLSWLGLVEIRNGVGTIVTELDMDWIRDAYEMRLHVAEQLGHMSPAPITETHRAAAAGYRARAAVLADDFDLRAYVELNHDLHFTVAEIIGNRALREAWDRLYFQTARAWYQAAGRLGTEIGRDFLREMEDVVTALDRDDAVALGYAQRNAIYQGYRRIFPTQERL